MTPFERRAHFFELHANESVFIMANPWDVGSAKLLAAAGFKALATTSAGFAWANGRADSGMVRDELVEHVRLIADATELPLNVDSERCFAEDLAGVAETVRMLHDAGAAGCSIEDWNLATNSIDPIEVSIERVAAAANAAHRDGDRLVLTARCENLIRDVPDLDDTILRLLAYQDAGADCLYAPGLATIDQISAVVAAVDRPINVLALPGGPSVSEIGDAGARRISTGASLMSTAYGALMLAARELLESGTSSYLATRLSGEDLAVMAAD